MDCCYLMTGPNFHHFHFVLTGSVFLGGQFIYGLLLPDDGLLLLSLLLLLSTSLLSDLKLFFFDTGL